MSFLSLSCFCIFQMLLMSTYLARKACWSKPFCPVPEQSVAKLCSCFSTPLRHCFVGVVPPSSSWSSPWHSGSCIEGHFALFSVPLYLQFWRPLLLIQQGTVTSWLGQCSPCRNWCSLWCSRWGLQCHHYAACLVPASLYIQNSLSEPHWGQQTTVWSPCWWEVSSLPRGCRWGGA